MLTRTCPEPSTPERGYALPTRGFWPAGRIFISFLLVFIALFAWPHRAQATHLVGGSITYQYIGQFSGYYRYKVTVDMYRDCSVKTPGVSPTPFDPTIDIGVYERKADTTLAQTLTLSLGSDVSVPSPSASSHCKAAPPNVCTREGLYEGYLNVPPSNYGYYLVHIRCCRNTMVNVPDNEGQTYFAIIPPTTILNSTPVFNAVPAPYICSNDTISLLYSASEPDGDSLIYTLARPYAGGDSATPIPGVANRFTGIPLVSYKPGYSPAFPMGTGGFVAIDKFTGVLTMLAPSVGRYAIAVDVHEYRNGRLISVTRRDVQIISEPCDPHPAPRRIPIADSLAVDNSTTTTYTIEAGERLAFNLRYVADQSNVTGFKYSGFFTRPNTFTYQPSFTYFLNKQYVTAYFEWQTTCKDASSAPYTFTVTVSDTGCPAKQTYQGIKIFVVPFKGANHINGPAPACQGLPGSVYSTSPQKPGYSLSWIVTGGTYTKGPNDSSITVIWGNSPTGTIKLIGYNTLTGCQGDTTEKVIVINPKPALPVINGPLTSCVGNIVSYSVPTRSNSMLYKWNVAGGLLTQSGGQNKSVLVKWNIADTDTLAVMGIDSNGCKTDTAVIYPIVEKPIADSIFGSYSVCPNSSGIDYWVKPQDGSSYYWKVSGGAQVAGGNTSHIKIDWGSKGGGTVEVVEVTAHGCSGDTVKLKVLKDYVLFTTPIAGDTSLCEYTKGVAYSVNNSNGSNDDWKILGGTIVAGNGTASIVVDWDKAGKGALMVTETAYDPVNNKPCTGIPVSAIISINAIPNTSQILGPSEICENDIVVYRVNGLPGSTYQWKFHGKTNLSTADSVRWQETGLTDLSDTINVEVTEYSKDSCEGPARYLVVKVHKVPVTSAIQGPSLICFPNLSGAVYSVSGFSGSIYDWTVDGGAVVDGDKTSKITVDWYVEGNRSVHVQEITGFGCKGPLKNLDVKVDSLAMDMDLVTTNVQNDQEIDVYWTKKNNEFFNGYFRIYRSQQGQEFFRLIDSVPATQSYYVDKNVNTSQYAYRYQIEAVNSCGTAIKTTVHRTIKLSGNFDEDTTINLHWNPYVGWPVDRYNINNSQDNDTTVTIYNFTKDTAFAVVKTLEGYRMCMRIAAFKAGSGLKNVISWSNKICVDFDPFVWIPNVFTPQNGDNLNNTFHIFAGNYKTYHLDIYNRWGEHIFTSDDPSNQWDGTWKGGKCVEGVYLYMVTIMGAKSNLYRSGTVNLLR